LRISRRGHDKYGNPHTADLADLQLSETRMTRDPFNEVAEADLGYGQLFAILLRRRWCFLGVFTGAVSVAIAITLTTQPTYRSQMQLLVEPNYPQKESLADETQKTQTSEEDYATQLALMQSSQFTDKAAALLRKDYPEIQGSDIDATLILYQVESTRIFEAAYTDTDAMKTQKVLEALQTVYQAYNLEQDQLRLTQGLAFIDEQSVNARDRLLETEGSLEEFRQNQNLIDPEQQAQAVADALNAVEQERRALTAQYADVQTRYEVLQGQLSLSPQQALTAARLSQSPRYQALLDELQKTDLELARQRVRLTDAHPTIRELLETRQRQLRLLAEESQRVGGGVANEVTVSGEALRQEGQLGKTEQDLAGKLVETQSELQALQARDRTLAATEAQLRAELDRFPGLIAEYNRLQPEVDIQQNTIKQLLETQQALSLELARGGFKWQVVEPPQPGEQIAPQKKKNLLLGGVVGLFLGGLAAFAREALDDSVRSSDQLKQKVALPLLGMVPQLPPAKVHRSIVPFRPAPNRAAAILPLFHWQPFRESLDLIYKNIQLLGSTPSPRSLLVTSALPGEGKSTLVLGLALSAARLHQKVLLVDADLRRPTLHTWLDLPETGGLSGFLSGESDRPEVRQLSIGEITFDVLSSGGVPRDPLQLLSSQRMRDLMAEFERTYDLVLVDTSPILGTVDVLQTALLCSGVVILVRLDRITQSELTEAIASLGRFKVLGIIANGSRSYPVYDLAQNDLNGRLPSPVAHSLGFPEAGDRN
jgi:polysaccharide biosynthesis transport protein